MAEVVAPLVVRQHSHRKMCWPPPIDGKINAGATAPAEPSNAGVIQLLEECGIIAIAMLEEPADDREFVRSQGAFNLKARGSMAHGSNLLLDPHRGC